jgi:hypothetical protein
VRQTRHGSAQDVVLDKERRGRDNDTALSYQTGVCNAQPSVEELLKPRLLPY